MGLTQVSTDGVKNDAITKTKIPANQIEASELADNAVDTNAIADNAVTAGKLASGVQTTINNNADNRVITGSGTANTLEGESSLTYNGSDLNISNDVPQLLLTDNNSNSSIGRVRGNGGHLGLSADTNNATAGSVIYFEIDNSEQARIVAGSHIGIANTTPTGWGGGIPTVEFKGTSSTSRGGAIAFESHSGNNGYNVIYSDAGDLRIYTGATNRASATEKVMFPRTGGITFNGDTAAANALDDYEEGTFTLSVSSGGFSSVAGTGTYTKIGRTVIFQGDFSLVGSGNSSVLKLNGLPFTSNSWAACSGYTQNYNNEGSQQASFAVRGDTGTHISVVEYGSEMTGNAFNSGYMNVAGCYQTA